MPVTITGAASTIGSRAAPTMQAPASGDFPSDVSNNQPDRALLDYVASLLAHAGILNLTGLWTALQTMAAGVSVYAYGATAGVSGYAAAILGRVADVAKYAAALVNDSGTALYAKGGAGPAAYFESTAGARSSGGVVTAFDDSGAGVAFQAQNAAVGFDANGAPLPVILGSRTTDPTFPGGLPEGTMWVDRSASRLCVVANGTIHRFTLP